jgi:hypothetical protein
MGNLKAALDHVRSGWFIKVLFRDNRGRQPAAPPHPQRVDFGARAWQNETTPFANPLFCSTFWRPQRDLKSLIGNREIHWRDAGLPRKPRQSERFSPLGAVPSGAAATRRVEARSAKSWQKRGKENR